MPPVRNGRVIFSDYPEGYPDPEKTLKYDSSQTIDIEKVGLNGGALVKILALSVDPYLRNKMTRPEVKSGYKAVFKLGETIANFGVGVVLRSDNPDASPGDHLYGFFNFEEYTIIPDPGKFMKINKPDKIPWSAYVGVCGMPGKTAYYGYMAYVHPRVKKGDTLFVTTGAGPVGSLVIQLAKQDGLKVIGSAGSEEKVQFMKECGADVAFNYKSTDTKKVLEEHGPINAYWDHVGGEILDVALEAAAEFAIFIECGMITGYNHGHVPVKNLKYVLFKNMTMQGFVVGNLEAQFGAEFYRTIPPLVAGGGIKYSEYRKNGLEAVGQMFTDQQLGKNIGKAVIILADE